MVGKQSVELPVRKSAPEAIEQDMLDSQGGVVEPEPQVGQVEERLRGTGVGASQEAYPNELVEGRDTKGEFAGARGFAEVELSLARAGRTVVRVAAAY